MASISPSKFFIPLRLQKPISTFFASLMHRRPSNLKGKSKRRASPSPTPSSDRRDSTPDQIYPSPKRLRPSSPERIKQAALAKVVSKSKAGSSSSSKGLAGFAALVSNANLSAARTETSLGLRSGRSRGGGASTKPKAGKTV